MQIDQKILTDQVQKNCDIADARHAGEQTLCVYLLKMREFFRWERQKSFTDSLAKAEVGAWITQKEQYWEQLGNSEFAPIRVSGAEYDPFDTEGLNAVLNPQGLVYSGGLSGFSRPNFFLGELRNSEDHAPSPLSGNYHIRISSREFARNLTAPPAYTLGTHIFIRRESLRRVIWEKIEEWQWRKRNNAMERALTGYDYETDPGLSLEQITDLELNTVVLHEIGEVKASALLGEKWRELLFQLPPSQAERMARAVKDHIADCLSTLPSLIEQNNQASLHFYFSNLGALRHELFPQLTKAYQLWLDNDNLATIENTVKRGCQHWQNLAQQMLTLFDRYGPHCAPHIEKMVHNNIL